MVNVELRRSTSRDIFDAHLYTVLEPLCQLGVSRLLCGRNLLLPPLLDLGPHLLQHLPRLDVPLVRPVADKAEGAGGNSMSERFCTPSCQKSILYCEYSCLLSSNGLRWMPSCPKRDARPHAEKPRTVDSRPMVVRVDEQTVPRTSDISD